MRLCSWVPLRKGNIYLAFQAGRCIPSSKATGDAFILCVAMSGNSRDGGGWVGVSQSGHVSQSGQVSLQTPGDKFKLIDKFKSPQEILKKKIKLFYKRDGLLLML